MTKKIIFSLDLKKLLQEILFWEKTNKENDCKRSSQLEKKSRIQDFTSVKQGNEYLNFTPHCGIFDKAKA